MAGVLSLALAAGLANLAARGLDAQTHGRRNAQAKGASNGCEVELVDVVHVLVRVARVRHEVAAVGVLGALVQVIVGAHELFHLLLHVGHLVRRELVLVHGDLGLAQVLQELEFARKQEQQRAPASRGATRGTAHTVDVLLRIIRRVELDDPVHVGDVEAAGRDVSAQQSATLGVHKLEEGGGALLLLLTAVDVFDREVHVLQERRIVSHGRHARHEDHDLLLLLLAQERV
mmetsp:Transcript_19410/g.55435  ORF Transcript_19410/g.55435 Transcript_19410/m.55435 type:complete len:231 (-) Transcript_19410:943-1635(-)